MSLVLPRGAGRWGRAAQPAWIRALSDRLILVYISHAGRIVKVPGQPNARKAGQRAGEQAEEPIRTPVNNIEYFPPNFEGLVLGCIDADFCK